MPRAHYTDFWLRLQEGEEHMWRVLAIICAILCLFFVFVAFCAYFEVLVDVITLAFEDVELEYPTGPMTLSRKNSEGTLLDSTKLESFTITKAKYSLLLREIIVNYQEIGTVKGYDNALLYLRCYDEEGFLLESHVLFDPVTDGERFRIQGETYIDGSTARIELVAVQ